MIVGVYVWFKIGGSMQVNYTQFQTVAVCEVVYIFLLSMPGCMVLSLVSY